jgi:hypothetical protein
VENSERITYTHRNRGERGREWRVGTKEVKCNWAEVDEIYNQEDVSFLVGYLSMGALFFYGSVGDRGGIYFL